MRLTRHEQELAAAGSLRQIVRFRCAACGKLSVGRLPREGRQVGNWSWYWPRRHDGANGTPCPGNTLEAGPVSYDPATLREM